MTPELRAFVQEYGSLPPAAVADFVSRFQRRNLPKGTMLLHPGEVCHELLFVQSGCLRTYYLAPDGLDISVWFSFPGYLSSELTSFISGEPSEYAVEAIADSEVLYLSKEALQELYARHPALHGHNARNMGIRHYERYSPLHLPTARHRRATLPQAAPAARLLPAHPPEIPGFLHRRHAVVAQPDSQKAGLSSLIVLRQFGRRGGLAILWLLIQIPAP